VNGRRAKTIRRAAAQWDARLPEGLPRPPAKVRRFRSYLQPDEIQAAMAFRDGYQVLGNKREKVAQLGNAVTPPVMRLLMARVLESLAA
jgi:site-specific DNA-cytosine methylase